MGGELVWWREHSSIVNRPSRTRSAEATVASTWTLESTKGNGGLGERLAGRPTLAATHRANPQLRA